MAYVGWQSNLHSAHCHKKSFVTLTRPLANIAWCHNTFFELRAQRLTVMSHKVCKGSVKCAEWPLVAVWHGVAYMGWHSNLHCMAYVEWHSSLHGVPYTGWPSNLHGVAYVGWHSNLHGVAYVAWHSKLHGVAYVWWHSNLPGVAYVGVTQ